MEQANVVPRMNPLVLGTDRKYLDFTATPGTMCPPPHPLPPSVSSSSQSLNVFFFFFFAVVDDWEDTTMFSFLDSRDKAAVMAKRMKYFTNSGKTLLVISCLAFHINTISDECTPCHFQSLIDLEPYK